VFPGKEIIQPTIVEAVSFMAWKVPPPPSLFDNLTNSNRSQDEAFELGMQWSKLYSTGTPSQKLIAEVMETYTLVNVVHNDFRAPEAIFAPFYRAAQFPPPSTNGLSNGHHGINGFTPLPITNGLKNGHA